MKRYAFAILIVFAFLVCGVGYASAQGAASAPAAPAGVRGEVLFWIQDAENKLTALAQAIPQEKYTWRPGEGVRSVSEVFLHVASGNYGIPTAIGVQPPAGINRQGFETSTTDKTKIIEQLKASFAHVREAVSKVSDADLDKPVKLFGRDTTQRNVLLLLATHTHEHLGQMIAYTRVNGVVPPWTEERQRQQQQRQPAKKGQN